MLRRFTNSNGTTILTFPFGIEEHKYTGAGTSQSNTYYYYLAGRLLGSLDSNGTQFYLTNALGSLVSDFTNASGGAVLKGNELFGPYGNGRYNAGTTNTAKGFLSQYKDGSGLDYLHARYYDPVVGVLLSADKVQSNPRAMNPHAYVGGNPETKNDPTGQMYINPGGVSSSVGSITGAGAGINRSLLLPFPRKVLSGISSVTPSDLTAAYPKVKLGPTAIIPISNGHTSCGTPDVNPSVGIMESISLSIFQQEER